MVTPAELQFFGSSIKPAAILLNTLSDEALLRQYDALLLAKASYSSTFPSKNKGVNQNEPLTKDEVIIGLSSQLSAGEMNYLLSRIEIEVAIGFGDSEGKLGARYKSDSSQIILANSGTNDLTVDLLYQDILGILLSGNPDPIGVTGYGSDFNTILNAMGVTPISGNTLWFGGHSLAGAENRSVAAGLQASGYNIGAIFNLDSPGQLSAVYDGMGDKTYYNTLDGKPLTVIGKYGPQTGFGINLTDSFSPFYDSLGHGIGRGVEAYQTAMLPNLSPQFQGHNT